MKDEILSDEQLKNVAGGTRQEFEDICKALGKSPTWSTRDGIRKYLAKNFNIEVVHWNTGDRGSPRNAPAEFYFNGKQISFDEVLDILDV
ncbi:MAG: hypothetical protein IK062_11005 [Selenomonadaceae bacterium]|nr:hypothetical protein [Selenomonadaceae bacterium]